MTHLTVETWMIERPGKWLRWFRRRRLLAAIAAFRGGGGRTALVSDYPARKKLARMEVAHLFDAVVANGEPGEAGRLKPDPAGFLAAAQRLGVAPAACLVIGDRDDADGAAARRAGMDYQAVQAGLAALEADLLARPRD
jgi:beta-phosphoglucomutase-like phosphatase (HAD superfamily)